MSIISTVYVPEGIAMAADSRMSGTTTLQDGTKYKHTLSDNSQKLFLIKNNTIGIACCGDAIIGGKFVGDFIREFEIKEIKENDTVEDIAYELNEYTKKLHGNGVIYHVSGYINDIPYVYKIVNGEVVRNNIDQNGNVRNGFTWNGDPEALRKLVLGEPPMQFNFNFMQLKDGIDLAEFLIDLTIKYQRFDMRLATCGGPIDILVITKDYAKFIKHKILNP